MAEQKVSIKSKEKLYRGKTLEELKAMDVRESTKFMESRQRRFVLRNFDKIEKFIKRCEKKLERNKRIKTHDRDLVIVPQLVGMEIAIHSGKSFEIVPITHEMIGHKFGEFVTTRKRVSHGSAGIGATKSTRSQKK